jgi:hypothetical protein
MEVGMSRGSAKSLAVASRAPENWYQNGARRIVVRRSGQVSVRNHAVILQSDGDETRLRQQADANPVEAGLEIFFVNVNR